MSPAWNDPVFSIMQKQGYCFLRSIPVVFLSGTVAPVASQIRIIDQFFLIFKIPVQTGGGTAHLSCDPPDRGRFPALCLNDPLGFPDIILLAESLEIVSVRSLPTHSFLLLSDPGHKLINYGQVNGLEIIVYFGCIAFGRGSNFLPLIIDFQTFFNQHNVFHIVFFSLGIHGDGSSF